VIEARVARRNARWENPGEVAPFRRRWQEWLPLLHALAGRTSVLAKGYVGEAPPLVDMLEAALAEVIDETKVLELATRLLQSLTGVGSRFGLRNATCEPQVCTLVYEYENEDVARACLETAIGFCRAAARDEPFEVCSSVRDLVTMADAKRLGPSSLAILRAAMARGIPIMPLNTGSSLVQLGDGCRQRRVWTAESDATSAIAESIAQDKELTKRLLHKVGVPVPRGRSVQSGEDAWLATREIGVPVTVKPRRANHARGISLDLETREQVLEAYEWAIKDGGDSGVLVEQHATGSPHRLLVIGGRLVAAARGESESVVGDSRRTIRELVDEVNLDPRRGENYTDLLSVLKVDDGALIELRKQGYTPESVPGLGVRVLVQRVGDLTIDCTAEVHPTTAAMAVLAARIVGLDIAGIDVIAEEIGRPLADQRGVVLEVNAGPSLSMHVAPLRGQPQPVGEALIEHLFPAGATGMVPIIVVTGTGDRRGVVHQIEACLRQAGYRVGCATDGRITLDGELASISSGSDFDDLATLRLHPWVEAIVCESHPEQAFEVGLGCSRVDLAVITDQRSENGGRGPSEMDESTLLGILSVVRAVPSEGIVAFPERIPQDCSKTVSNRCRATGDKESHM